jgi:hypothetical protein
MPCQTFEPARGSDDQQHRQDANHDAWEEASGVEVLTEKFDLEAAVLIKRVYNLTCVHHDHPAGTACQRADGFLMDAS